MKSKVTIKVPRNIKDKGGFVVNVGECVQTPAGFVLDLFAMPIKPMRLYLDVMVNQKDLQKPWSRAMILNSVRTRGAS